MTPSLIHIHFEPRRTSRRVAVSFTVSAIALFKVPVVRKLNVSHTFERTLKTQKTVDYGGYAILRPP